MDARKFARSHTTEDNVVLWLLPYETPLHERILLKMGEAFGTPSGEGLVTLPVQESVFALCAPLTVGIDLPVDPPLWSMVLSEFLKDRQYMADPVGYFNQLLAVAPPDLFEIWARARRLTRPVELMADLVIQERQADTEDDPNAIGSGGQS